MQKVLKLGVGMHAFFFWSQWYFCVSESSFYEMFLWTKYLSMNYTFTVEEFNDKIFIIQILNWKFTLNWVRHIKSFWKIKSSSLKKQILKEKIIYKWYLIISYDTYAHKINSLIHWMQIYYYCLANQKYYKNHFNLTCYYIYIFFLTNQLLLLYFYN